MTCASCGEQVDPGDLFQGAEGMICAACQLDHESSASLARSDRELALTTLFVPGWVGVALLLLVPTFSLFGSPRWLGLVPAAASAAGLLALHRSVRADGIARGDRVRLGAAGVTSFILCALLAVALVATGG